MSECQIGFISADNDLARRLYEELAGNGIGCEQLDVGYGAVNYTGAECPAESSQMTSEFTCLTGARDGFVRPEEVFEYALNNYETDHQLIAGVLGRPLPWVLDDLDPDTTFDNDIRVKVQAAIDKLKEILTAQNFEEGSEEYKEKMATGLYYLLMSPDASRIEEDPAAFETMTDELQQIGLQEFREYLRTQGGFYLAGDEDIEEEYSALEAISNRRGECTERSKVLYAMMKMAGLSPAFVQIDYEAYMDHTCVGLNVNGRLRIYDGGLESSDANFSSDRFYTVTLRQYLSQDYTNVGGMWSHREDYDPALAAFGQAMNIDPNYPKPHLGRGVVWFKEEDYEQALADYNEAIRLDPNYYADAYLNRGNVWLKMEEFDKAMADFTEAIRIRSDFAMAYFARGSALFSDHDYDSAISDLTEAINIDPDYADAYYYRGFSYFKKDDLINAIVDVSEVLRLRPDDQLADITLDLVWWGLPAEDRVVVSALSMMTMEGLSTASDYFDRAALWLQIDEVEKAVFDFSAAIDLNPQDARLYYGRGQVLYDQGDREHAIADFTLAIENDSNFWQAYYARGFAFCDMGERDKAIADFTEAIRINPDYADAFFARGLARYEKGEMDLAIADYNEAIRIRPEYAPAYNNLGAIHLEREEYEEAIADFNKAVEIDTFFAGALTNLGTTYYRQENYDMQTLYYGMADSARQAIEVHRRYEEQFGELTSP